MLFMKDFLIFSLVLLTALILTIAIFMACFTENDGIRSNQNASELKLLQLCFDVIDGTTPAKL